MSALKVLITGGAGFIGSHLTDRLLAQGHEVTVLDNFVTGSRNNLAAALGSGRFRLVEGDVQDGLPEGDFDRIYNLACPASPLQYQKDPVATMRTNVLGALNVLDYARRRGARVLQASTSEVYGDPDVSPQSEEYLGLVNCAGRRACYDEGKRAAETLFYDYHRQYGIEIRVARIFNTYGPRMAPDDGRVIPNFITQALLETPLTIYGEGGQTRSFCYIDDMVDALIRLMEAGGERVGPVNLGNPAEFTIALLAAMVLEMTGSQAPVSMLPLPEDDPKIRQPSIDKAQSLLAWTPKIPLREGLAKTIAWYRSIFAYSDEAPSPAAPVREEGLNPFAKSARPAPPSSVEKGGPGSTAIIGAGPAGLTAAYVLQKESARHRPIVIEASDLVGGIARTESYKGYRFDIGGHRFFTKVGEVEALWREVGGEDFITRPRQSRIYYREKYYSYPLKIFNALGNMGPIEASFIMLSYMKWRLLPHREEENLEQWVTNRFGARLYQHFFKTYTEKVWGISCTEIRADWAAQRIKNLSLTKAVWNALTGANDTASLIEEFQYPRLGPGMMWEKFRDRVRERGGEVRMNSAVSKVHLSGDRVRAIDVVERTGETSKIYTLEAEHFISSMPLAALISAMEPAPPTPVIRAAKKLKYRDFLIVTLILNRADPFPDNWIYIHSPSVKVGRIQNFRAWSEEMVPEPGKSSIGMEYFCNIGDSLWEMSDAELIKLATRELAALGLAREDMVVDGAIIRQPKAYPVYDGEYREALDVISEWLKTLKNFQTVGRNGMHRYNNQDHSMLTALLAARNILGEEHDLWNVNVERSYHEEFTTAEKAKVAA